MSESTTLAVHRCRFVDYTPSAITVVAFPPLPLPPISEKGKTASAKQSFRFGTLAVGHANGNIDLCEWAGGEHDHQSSQAWVIRKTLPGPYPSKVDSLAFVIRYPDDLNAEQVPSCSDLRLFSSGGGSELLEWDMERASVRRTISSQGGSIWCMAANPASNLLALGCEDGTVRLLSLVNDTLTHFRRFDRVKCRILSIAWGPPSPQYRQKDPSENVQDDDSDDDDDTWNDSWLVTGCSDSSIRKWDVSTGRVIDRMGTDKVRGERTLVWTVGVFGDGTIVSGDSLGMVKFWDSRTCTQLQSFQGHGADVLCLTVGPEGSTVFTSGVDQKITLFSLVRTGSSSSTSNVHAHSRWVQSCSRRMHSHDVRSLATWPPYTALPPSHKRRFPMDISPIIASGGLDMSVVVTPAALPSTTVVKVINPLSTSAHCTFEDSYHRRLAYSSGASGISAIQIARKARLVSCIRDSGLSIWRIKARTSGEAEDVLENHVAQVDPESTAGWERVLEMDLNVHTNLIGSGISDDGQWLVVSDLYESKLFSLSSDAEGEMVVRRIREFSSILQANIPNSTVMSTGGQVFQFTPDSSKLVMSTAFSSYVLVIDLTGETPRVLRRFGQHRTETVVGDRVVRGRKMDEEDEDGEGVVGNIVRMAVSTDGQWLATSDDRGRTHIFNLDSIQHHSVLPTFSKPAQALAFDPTSPDILLIAFPDNSLQIYNVESRQFPAWGKALSTNLPKRFTQSHDPILGLAFDPSSPAPASPVPQHALVWGSTWVCKLFLTDSVQRGITRKRRRESTALSAPLLADDSHGDFKMVMHYRPILCLDFLAGGELVVVERPLVDVLSDLPPAYFKHKYGAS